jgi:membrane fusion protein (multidrug efflux system)
VVQRLPVRIELLEYDPGKTPLFIGLSVAPYVRVREAPTGLGAGAMLQPYGPQRAPTSEPGAQP